MKIRTQFMLSTLVLGSFLLLVTASEIITNSWIQKLNGQEELAAQIERQAYELGYLANDYLLYRESQQANRWESKFASFSENVSNMDVNTPEQQALLANIKNNQQRLRSVFAEVRASIESALQTQGPMFDTKFMQVSWSRLEVQTQGMIFDASRLEGMLREQEDRLRHMTGLFSFVLIAVLGGFLLGSYGLTFRRTLSSIVELQAGTKIIGSGDLDFAIAVKKEDEIGELSRAFNQMTASLKQVTASKADLEKEVIERKWAEEGLRQKEAELKEAQRIAHIGSWHWDAKTDMTTGSDELLRIYGIDPARGAMPDFREQRGRYYPVKDWERLNAAVEGSLETGVGYELDVRAIRSNAIIWITTRSEVVHDADGQIIGLRGTVQDITERKRAEEALRKTNERLQEQAEELDVQAEELRLQTEELGAQTEELRLQTEELAIINAQLRESEQRYSAIFEKSSYAISLTSMPKGILVGVNDAFLRLFEYRREELIGKISVELGIVDPEFRAQVNAKLRAHGSVHDLEVTRTTKTGARLILSLNLDPISINGVDHILTTIRDITERKQIEDALRHSEARFRLALTHAPVSVATQDCDLVYTWAYNQKTRTQDEIIGKSDFDLFPAEAAHLAELKRRVLETGENISEQFWVTSNNQRLFLDLFIEPLWNEKGEIDGLGLATVDLTQVKLAEQRIAAHTSEIQAANQELNTARLAALNLIEDTLRAQKELQKVNARLRESEQHLNRAQEIAHLGSWELDLVYNQLAWSDEVYRIFGLQPQEFGATYEAFLEAVHPDDRAAVDEAYSSSIREGRDSYEIEHRVVKRSSGEIRFVHEKCEHFRNEAGQTVRSVGMVHDVTERKQAESLLWESEERFRAVVENALDAIVVTDPARGGKVLSANPAACHLFGYSQEEFIGLSREAMLDTSHPNFPAFLNQRNHQGRAAAELTYKRKDGLCFLGELSTASFQDKNGERRAVAIIRDITQRKQAEEALRRAHDELELRVQERTKELEVANLELMNEIYEREQADRQLRIQTTAMEAAANGILITDPEGEILWVNPALTRMTGYTVDDLMGQSMRIFKSGQHDGDYYRQMWATVLAGEVWHGETTNRRKDGSLYIEEQTITPVLGQADQISHFIAIKQDITEQKQAKLELEKRNLELQALSISERNQRQAAETLRAATQALTQSLDLDTVLNTLLKHVTALIETDLASVGFVEDETRLVARIAQDPGPRAKLDHAPIFPIDAKTDFFFQKVATSRRSLIVRDATRAPDWIDYPGVEPLRSWMGVPILVNEKVIGVVLLGKVERGFFTREHAKSAEALVSQAAVAIQNAWLFEQVRAGRERLQLLSRRLVEIQESERRYIARELHDQAGQSLTSLMLGLGQLERGLDPDADKQARTRKLKLLANDIQEGLHRLAVDLRPASLDHLGLVPALEQLVNSYQGNEQLEVKFKAVGLGEAARLSSEVETTLFRIVQEALTNVYRHAKATRADVILELRDHDIVLIVEDNGIGFDATFSPDNEHLGLIGIRERTEMLGGNLTVESIIGSGTILVVEVPNADPYPAGG